MITVLMAEVKVIELPRFCNRESYESRVSVTVGWMSWQGNVCCRNCTSLGGMSEPLNRECIAHVLNIFKLAYWNDITMDTGLFEDQQREVLLLNS